MKTGTILLAGMLLLTLAVVSAPPASAFQCENLSVGLDGVGGTCSQKVCLDDVCRIFTVPLDQVDVPDI